MPVNVPRGTSPGRRACTDAMEPASTRVKMLRERRWSAARVAAARSARENQGPGGRARRVLLEGQGGRAPTTRGPAKEARKGLGEGDVPRGTDLARTTRGARARVRMFHVEQGLAGSGKRRSHGNPSVVLGMRTERRAPPTKREWASRPGREVRAGLLIARAAAASGEQRHRSERRITRDTALRHGKPDGAPSPARNMRSGGGPQRDDGAPAIAPRDFVGTPHRAGRQRVLLGSFHSQHGSVVVYQGAPAGQPVRE